MIRYLFFFLLFLSSISMFSQKITKTGEKFNSITTVDGKVVFLKETKCTLGNADKICYERMADWAKENYGRDPFISSLRYDPKKNEFIAKSKVELLLPANSANKREKMIMRYRINGFLIDGKCVLEITDISYLYENSKSSGLDLSKILRAEAFITDEEIAKKDKLTEIKTNTRKSTIFFINELTTDFEKFFLKH